MAKKTPVKVARALHAMIDEVIANGPETATALNVVLQALTAGDVAVEVKATRKATTKPSNARSGKRGGKKAEPEFDEEILDEDEDEDYDEDEGEDLDEDEEEDEPEPVKKPRNTRSGKRGGKKAEPEVDDDEDEDEAEAIELAGLDVDSLWDAVESEAVSDAEISPDYKKTGIRELNTKVAAWGFDAADAAGDGTRTERANSLRALLSGMDGMVDAVADYGVDEIKEAYAEAFDEDMPHVKGRGKAKTKAVAHAFLEAMLTSDEE